MAAAVMLKAGLKPLELYISSSTKWKSECITCKRTVSPTYSSIQQGQGGCEYCSGKRVDPSTVVMIMREAGLIPLEPYKSSKSNWMCQCSNCGEIVYPKYGDIQRGQGGCIPCGYAMRIDPNKINEAKALEIMVMNGLQPLEPYRGAGASWKVRCMNCNKTTTARLSHVKMGENCGYCARKKMDPEDAEALMLKRGYKPLEPYKGAKQNWKCLHIPCGNIVQPRYGHIQSGSNGCAFCAPFGINLETPSYIYIITNKELSSHKVGIGNHKEKKDRLQHFIKHGWIAHKVWQTESGRQALDIESTVFNILRKDMKLPIYLSKEDMPKTGGHSETVDAELITLLELEKIVKKVIRGMKNG